MQRRFTLKGKQEQKITFPVAWGWLRTNYSNAHHFKWQMSQAAMSKLPFVGHSTFMMETPSGVAASTDYAGLQTPDRVPDIVTMNNSHSSHWTEFLDSKITHVLRGWDLAGGIVRHHLQVRDMRIYNLPTNIFNFGKGARNGNSVFVFEAGGLCMAHLGHLHHFLSKEQVAHLGRIDVLYVPIDGVNTLSHEEALHIIGQINPRIVMPMHLSAFGMPEAFPATAGQSRSQSLKQWLSNPIPAQQQRYQGQSQPWPKINVV